MKFVWTELAWERLTEVEAFVARDNPAAAAKLVDRAILRACGHEAIEVMTPRRFVERVWSR